MGGMLSWPLLMTRPLKMAREKTLEAVVMVRRRLT